MSPDLTTSECTNVLQATRCHYSGFQKIFSDVLMEMRRLHPDCSTRQLGCTCMGGWSSHHIRGTA